MARMQVKSCKAVLSEGTVVILVAREGFKLAALRSASAKLECPEVKADALT